MSLLTRSTTLVPAGERYTLDLNRLRLELAGQPLETLRIELQYDNEVFLGSYLRTTQSALTRHHAGDTFFDLERTYVDHPSVVARHRMYRARVSWSGTHTDITLGRQRIAWGTGRFWSPLDILNPFDATRLEREERPGVDALLVDRKIGPLGKFNGVFAPATARSRAAIAGYVHGNAHGTDYSLLLGNFRGERLVGADFSGRLGGVGIRGEVTASRPDTGRFIRALFGADYGFGNTFTVTAELYFNGEGASQPSFYDFPGLFEGRVRSVARRYGAIAVSYQISPLLKAVNYSILNVDDRSRAIWPMLEYSAATNFDLSGGIQMFSGTVGTEYGRFRDVLHFQAKWFF